MGKVNVTYSELAVICLEHMKREADKGKINGNNGVNLWGTFIKWQPKPQQCHWVAYSDVVNDYESTASHPWLSLRTCFIWEKWFHLKRFSLNIFIEQTKEVIILQPVWWLYTASAKLDLDLRSTKNSFKHTSIISRSIFRFTQPSYSKLLQENFECCWCACPGGKSQKSTSIK